MKFFIIFYISFPLTVLAHSTGVDTTHNFFSRYKTRIIKLPSEIDHTKPKPETFFDIVDARQDTKRIGIYYDKLLKTYLQVNIEQTVSTAIANYLNARFFEGLRSDSFKIVLRKLWISDLVFGHIDEIDETDKFPKHYEFRFKAEIYLKSNNGYFPVLRFDTIAHYSKNLFFGDSKEISRILDAMTGLLSAYDLNNRAKARKILQWDTIDAVNKFPFTHNVFRDSIIHPGVYMNFEEFQNNKPSAITYELVKKDDAYLLYVKDEKGEFAFTRLAWGICDGKTIYAMLEDQLYPIMREENAYYLMGAKQVEIRAKSKLCKRCEFELNGTTYYPGSTPKASDYHGKIGHKLHPLSIDMETGEIY